MSCLSMMEAKLPPGFRFHPRDDELICHYLLPKATNGGGGGGGGGGFCSFPMMVDVDLNKCEPWDLPEMACVGGKEWYFFNLRDRKYATGQRTNRATLSGYWKATGKDRPIVRKGVLVGMRKTLVFYQGRAPKGKKTDWVMHEFRIEPRTSVDPPPKFSSKEDWVLCRVFYKSRGLGMCSKPAAGSESCYDDTGSSSLPPLTDNYIAFDQAFPPPPPRPPLNLVNTSSAFANATAASTATFEQVPCFSNFTTQVTTPFQQYYMTSTDPAVIPCDQNKVIKSFLDHLSKADEQKKREVEVQQISLAQASSESYLSEAALSSSMWYPF